MAESYDNFIINILNPDNQIDVKLVRGFLKKFNIDFIPEECDKTIFLENTSGEFIGTGSCKRNVLKFIAVDQKSQGTSASGQIVSALSESILPIYKHIFIYTHPRNKEVFVGLGFNMIAEALPHYSLFEFGYEGIENYKQYLLSQAPSNLPEATAIVMNCNPFSLGHQYLIEQAAKDSKIVYLFVVESELSTFPFEVRWNLIKQGISHLNNVVMLKTSDYQVSQVSFPTYFLKGKSQSEITSNQARLDLTIFVNHIAPTLNIKKRFVGCETYCKTTSLYNQEMKKILPENGIELVEVERKSIGENDFISASSIRKALKENDWERIESLVPKSTMDFLKSDNAIIIIESIRNTESRH